MNTFSLVQQALDAALADESKSGLGHREVEAGVIVTAVQTVVDALTPPDGGRYIIGFADITTAQTSLGERRITVSAKPLRDNSLSRVEKAVVIATFAAHEIGHTLVTRPRGDAVTKHNHHSGYHAVTNLADDIILEPYMVDRYPILADAFAFTGLWVLRNTAKSLPKVEGITPDMTTPQKFNILLSATRYGDIPEITFDGKRAIEERDWARDWAARLIATPIRDDATFLALCDEAWVRIRTPEPEPEPIITEPQPSNEQGEDGEPEDGEDEGDGQPGESDEDEDGDDGDESAPGDEQGEDEGDGGSDESDEDGEPEPGEGEGQPGPGEGESDANDAPLDFDDDGDLDGDDEGGDTEGDGESLDVNESEDDGPTGTSADGEATDDEDANGKREDEDGAGGGGNASASDEPLAPEDDFDANEVDEGLHNSAEHDPYDWEAKATDDAVRSYSSTTVTAFGHHGSLSTTWS